MTSGMRETRRRVLLGGVSLGATVIGAACAQTGTAPEAAVTTRSFAPVTIDYATERTNTDMGAFVTGQARQIFEQRHPGVTLNHISAGNAKDKVLAQAAAGTPPHVLHLGGADLPSFAHKGLLLALDSHIQKDAAIKPADFVRNMWEVWGLKGKQYGLPREGGPLVLYYNKALLQAAGVQPPTESWTFEKEYQAASVALTKPGDPGVIGTDVRTWRNWLASYGGRIIDTGLTKCTLDQPEALEALQLYQDFRYRYKCAAAPPDHAAAATLQRFINGGLALLPQLRSAPGNAGFMSPNVAIGYHPKGKAGRFFVQPGNGLAVMQPNAAPDASFEVIKWYTSAEFQKMHYKQGIGGVVLRQSVLQSEEYLNSSLPREFNEFFAKAVPGQQGVPKLTNWPEIDDLLTKELTAFESGGEPAAAAARRVVPLVNAMIREGRTD